MGLFSRKSKSVRKEQAASTPPVKQEVNARPQSSHGQAQAKQSMLAKSRSVPSSRRTSFSRDSGFISHPAYAPNNIIPLNSATQSYLPVPLIPTKMQKDRASAGKAAKLLGVDPDLIPSAPSSPRLSPLGHSGSDTERQPDSRHDSVNSHVDASRIGKRGSDLAHMNFSEELARESAFSEEYENSHKMRSISSAGYGHTRDVSHDSFRPTNARRHTLSQPPQAVSMVRQASQREMAQRGRSHQSIPSYSMPTNASRAYGQTEPERHTPRYEHPVMPPFAGAYQPRASSVTREQSAVSSPTMHPNRHTMYAEDAASMRSYTQPPTLSRQALHRHSSIAGPPPLSILDGLKVNRRGKILDEEGETIGELVDGDIIDCVRQKVNTYGEVVDEYGRIVGRVQTLVAGIQVSTPSIHMGSPAPMADRGVDYFNLLQQSPSLHPVMDAETMQRRMQEDSRQKYRILMDMPPVPSMPAHYQETRSPAMGAKRHALATFDQYDGDHCVELPANEPTEAADHDIPTFDLSEPFMPKARHATTPPLVEAPQKVSPKAMASPRVRRASGSAEKQIRPSAVPTQSPVVSSASESSTSSYASNTSSVSAPSSHASSLSIASSLGDDDDERFEDAETQAQRSPPQKKPEPVLSAPEPEIIGQAIEQPAPVQAAPVIEQKQIRPVRHGVPMHPRVIVPVSQLTKQTIKEDAAESPVARPITAVSVQSEMDRPAALSRARTAPSPATSSASIAAKPAMPRAETVSETTSAPTSGYTSAEESLSEGESVEVVAHQRKEVRISNLPPTTIPSRGLSRSLSDGTGLSRITAMPSVPESAPLPDTPRKSALLSPSDAMPRTMGARGIGARTSAPLPTFPRQGFSGLPSSPFAAANAAKNNSAGLQKRNSLPNRPGLPPAGVRSAMARGSKFAPNAPLVSSPLSDHRKTMSSLNTELGSSGDSTPFGSDSGSVRLKSDAVSIISTMSGGTSRTRTYFTHAGRVTVEDGDLPPSAQKKAEVVVAVTERPDTSGSKTESIKKRRFSLKIGSKKKTAAAA